MNIISIYPFSSINTIRCALFFHIFFHTALSWSEQRYIIKPNYNPINLTLIPIQTLTKTELRPITNSKTLSKPATPGKVVSLKSLNSSSGKQKKPNLQLIQLPKQLPEQLPEQSPQQQSGISPSLRYTGRMASDPLGMLNANETTLINSPFSQRGINRWGDYSAMTLDPVDDCTFWYTGLYVGNDDATSLSIGTWSTRIASFKFSECGGQFEHPNKNFDGINFTGSYPADPIGAAGLNNYIQMANSPDGAVFSIFSKHDGNLLVGPLLLSSLWKTDSACSNGRGDPIVIWDQFANRWVMLELGRNLRSLCVYTSVSDNPLTGGWYNYQLDTPFFPDYPKMAMYTDTNQQGAYIITSNEAEPAVYVLNREDLLSGNDLDVTRLTLPRLSGFAFQALTPADLDGKQALTPGTPVYLLRHFDDELHATESAIENYDFIEIWSIDLGFTTNSQVRISGINRIPVSDFESELCGTVSTGCFAQASTGTTLDPLFEVIMWRVTLRKFDDEQILLGNFTVDANGNDQGGIRWFDLRKQGRHLWNLHQQGTFAPTNENRWMASIAMDGHKNIAMGYSVSSADADIVDLNEPNNDLSSASIIECDAQTTQAIISQNDVDYYLLQANAGITAFINIDAAVDESPLNSLIATFDSSFKLLQKNETGLAADEKLLSEDSFLIQPIPDNGQLYIAVTSSGDNAFNGLNNTSSGFYRLAISCEETRVDSFEPNNSFRNAAQVNCPLNTLDTAISTSFDFDYFRFASLVSGQTITFNIDTSPSDSPLDITLRVFDSNGLVLNQRNNTEFPTEDNLSLSLQVPDDGILFGLISATDLISTGNYTFSCRQ